ncbi:MAG: hypothetical protein LBS42_03360 [Tannerella sp.]|jgi:hypothetical protein|nr:hypothetical protein [Tannerella sp.]
MAAQTVSPARPETKRGQATCTDGKPVDPKPAKRGDETMLRSAQNANHPDICIYPALKKVR